MRWPWDRKRAGRPRRAAPGNTVNLPEAAKAEAAGAAAGALPLPRLTPREREVFELLIQGKKLKEIAGELGIKYSTVNTHQKNVYKKLGVNTRAECILRYGLAQGRE